MKKRLSKVCCSILVMLIIGMIYWIWCETTHIGIPCLFHKLTGLYCPGCGVTRMCLSMMRLDFNSAFYNNPALFMMLPIGGVVALKWTIRYIRYGEKHFTKREESLFVMMIIVLILFGILRNIECFEKLRPL